VGALLDAVRSDENVSRAMLARKPKPIQEALDRERAEGHAEAVSTLIRNLCESLGVDWTAERASEVARMDDAALRALTDGLVKERHWPKGPAK